jgi:hypothetical protein
MSKPRGQRPPQSSNRDSSTPAPPEDGLGCAGVLDRPAHGAQHLNRDDFASAPQCEVLIDLSRITLAWRSRSSACPWHRAGQPGHAAKIQAILATCSNLGKPD